MYECQQCHLQFNKSNMVQHLSSSSASHYRNRFTESPSNRNSYQPPEVLCLNCNQCFTCFTPETFANQKHLCSRMWYNNKSNSDTNIGGESRPSKNVGSNVGQINHPSGQSGSGSRIFETNNSIVDVDLDSD